MTYEVIIAADKAKADAYAREQGWHLSQLTGEFANQTDDGYLRIDRPAKSYGVTTTMLVKFVATPMALNEVPQGTFVHVASFPGGIPAAWAMALARHSVVTDIRDKRIGAFKPMASAPKDRQILVFDGGRAESWFPAKENDGTFWTVSHDGFSVFALEKPVCWLELPENPPEVMIRAAMAEPAESS